MQKKNSCLDSVLGLRNTDTAKEHRIKGKQVIQNKGKDI